MQELSIFINTSLQLSKQQGLGISKEATES